MDNDVYDINRWAYLSLDNYVASLGAAIFRLDDIVAYTPIMLQCAKALANQSGIVNIYLCAIFAKDEAISSLIVEPFYSPLHKSIRVIS